MSNVPKRKTQRWKLAYQNIPLPKPCKGYTLVELTVSLTIIGLMAVFIGLRSPQPQHFALNNDLHKLLSDLYLTKTLSMSLSQSYQIVLTKDHYQIKDPHGVPFKHPDTQSTTLFFSKGNHLKEETTLIFDNLGRPFTATKRPLSTPLTLTLTGDTYTRTLTIEPYTGFAHE